MGNKKRRWASIFTPTQTAFGTSNQPSIPPPPPPPPPPPRASQPFIQTTAQIPPPPPPPPPKRSRWGYSIPGKSPVPPQASPPPQEAYPQPRSDSIPKEIILQNPEDAVTTNNIQVQTPKTHAFESKDAALKALKRRKRLQAWKEKMKQSGDVESTSDDKGVELSDGEIEELDCAPEQLNDSNLAQANAEVQDCDKESKLTADTEKRGGQTTAENSAQNSHVQLINQSSVQGESNLTAGSQVVLASTQVLARDSDEMLKNSNTQTNKSSVENSNASEQITQKASPANQVQHQSPSKQSPLKQSLTKQSMKKEQYLAILSHSLNCAKEHGKCQYFPQCWEFKSLWKHLPKCNQPKCEVPNCISSRQVLFEYMHYKKKTKEEKERQKAYSGAYCVAIVNKDNEKPRASRIIGGNKMQQNSTSDERDGVQNQIQQPLHIKDKNNSSGGAFLPKQNLSRQIQQTSQSKLHTDENDQERRLALVQADWSKGHNGNSDRYNRLNLLLHSSRCNALPGQCIYQAKCPPAKVLWKHMSGCNDYKCMVKDCVLSCQILRDYFNFTKKESPDSSAHSPVDTSGDNNSMIQNDSDDKKRQMEQTSESKAQTDEKDLANDETKESAESRLARLEAEWTKEDNGSSDRYDRLCLLLHASECNTSPGQCTFHIKCGEMKVLWKHMAGCNDITCTVKDCVLSCQLLRDYFNEAKKSLAKSVAPSLFGDTHSKSMQVDISPDKLPLHPKNSKVMESNTGSSPKQATSRKVKKGCNDAQSDPARAVKDGKEKLPPKRKKARLFKHQKAVIMEKTRAAPQTTVKKQRQGAGRNKVKKKPVSTISRTLWDYDFNLSESSDSDEEYESLFQMSVDDGKKKIWSKPLPTTNQTRKKSDAMPLREAATLNSKVNRMEDQIRRADNIIQTSTPSYLVYQSKGWRDVDCTPIIPNKQNSDTHALLPVPPSQKFHASSNLAGDFLSCFKSTALKAFRNSNQVANEQVIAFLTIIKQFRDNPQQSNPYKLIKQVWKLIQHVTAPLEENERISTKIKLKQKFDAFLPDGYSMHSNNYFLDRSTTEGETPEFVESCARTNLPLSKKTPR